jgi:hypothetical protein
VSNNVVPDNVSSDVSINSYDIPVLESHTSDHICIWKCFGPMEHEALYTGVIFFSLGTHEDAGHQLAQTDQNRNCVELLPPVYSF